MEPKQETALDVLHKKLADFKSLRDDYQLAGELRMRGWTTTPPTAMFYELTRTAITATEREIEQAETCLREAAEADAAYRKREAEYKSLERYGLSSAEFAAKLAAERAKK